MPLLRHVQIIEAGSFWTAGLALALQKLGCHLLDSSIIPDVPSSWRSYVHCSSGGGVLDALHGASGGDIFQLRTLVQSLELPDYVRTELRRLLLQVGRQCTGILLVAQAWI